MDNKICNTCKRTLPATTQYFYKCSGARDGLKPTCKECQGGKFILKLKAKKGYRICTRCKKELLETDSNFIRYYDKRDDKFRYTSECKECRATKCKEWRHENQEYYLSYAREYFKSERGKEVTKRYNKRNFIKVAERKRNYRVKNADKIKEYDRIRRNSPETREKVLQFARNWRKNNPDKVSEYNSYYLSQNKEYFVKKVHERNAKKMSLPHTFTKKEWEYSKSYFGYRCCYCGKEITRFTQDHYIPLSKNGPYTKGNILPCCKSCNSSKHDSEFKEWYSRQPFYSKEQENKILNYIKSMTIPSQAETKESEGVETR